MMDFRIIHDNRLHPRRWLNLLPRLGHEMITFLAPPLVMWFSAPFTCLAFFIDTIALDRK